jgi:hypothetical protein
MPPSPPLISGCIHSPRMQLPNPPFLLTQGRRILDPMEHQVHGLIADARIIIPEGDLLPPPLAELASLRCVPSLPRRRPGSPLGERPHHLSPG